MFRSVMREDTHAMELTRGMKLTVAESQQQIMTMQDQITGFGTMILFAFLPYCVLTESSTLQGTLGKRILGLTVTDIHGRRIGPGRALLRYVARMASATPWLFGFIMAGFTRKKQTLHDFLVGTLVVKTARTEPAQAPPGLPARMFCPECACELLDGAAFCHICGVAVSRTSPSGSYAGFWRRFSAMAIDVAILSLAFAVIGVFYLPRHEDLHAATRQFTGEERLDSELNLLLGSAWLLATTFFSFGIYYVLAESSPLQGTLGKRILGMRVTDLHGRRIRLGRATYRYLARALSTAVWFAGFIMAGLMPKKQSLHDVLAGTLVVTRTRSMRR